MLIAFAQSNYRVGDIRGNTEQIIKLVNDAGKLGADLVIFPELAITSYPPEDLLLRRALYEQITIAMQEIIAASNGIGIIIGFPEKTSKGIFNACCYIKDGQQQALYYKQNLPNYGVFDEKRYFSAGSENCLIDLDGIPAALSICEDIWSPDVARQAQAAGARLLININASPYHVDKLAERETILKQRVNETGLNIMYLNLVGAQDELVFDGASMVINSKGEFVFRAPQFEEGLYLIDLENNNDELEFHSDFSSVTVLNRNESIYQALVLGVRDYVRKNGFKGAVIGLSGGIDSALTLIIAVDALGAENVEVLIMPSRYTAEMSNDDAREMAKILSVPYHILPIQLPVSAFDELLQPVFANLPADTTEENIQARSRGVLLMAISNKTGKLVLTTGNKSEMSVGYATLYGDMAGGFAPLKDLSKTLCYELANWRNSAKQVIPQRIIDRPPSAELRPDQKDEDSLPSYDILDPILELYIELDQSPEQIVNAGFERETVLEIIRMVDRTEYKRRQAAPGVRITRRAFGRDRRYPITSGYREF
jgi:NAD+ synthase (glutamine-hydrolysing)